MSSPPVFDASSKSASDEDLAQIARRAHASRRRERLLAAPLDARVDLDALKGWSERREATLRSDHVLPALAQLSLWGEQSEASASALSAPLCWTIHAPEVLLGRYSLQVGPVDLPFYGLLDYELYSLAAPHARLAMRQHALWHVTRLSPQAEVAVNGVALSSLHRAHPVRPGDRLRLGVLRLRFEVDPKRDDALKRWQHQRADLLRTQRGAALFLKRAGSLCGPRYALRAGRAAVLGRSFPSPRALNSSSPWPDHPEPDWDLSGLPDEERRHLAFRHAALRPLHDQDWEIAPLSTRHHVSVNRLEIVAPTPLRDGDEIGLGGVLFYFHNPLAAQPSRHHTVKLPYAVDWLAERPSTREIPPPPKK